MAPDDARDTLARQRTDLAEERTRMSLDRTLLSWWRTALGCYGIGLAVAKFFATSGPAHVGAWLGAGFVVVGLVFAGLGYAEVTGAYRKVGRAPRWTVVVPEGLLLAAGLACLALAAS